MTAGTNGQTLHPRELGSVPEHGKPARVAVCIPTFRRPESLGRLLRALQNLTFRSVPRPDLKVVIVDNDADESARAVVEHTSNAGLAIEYHPEHRRGISYSRNTAVAAAAGADFIAFVDDDEVPVPAWLEELLLAHRDYDTSIVAGPVLPRFESSPPAWALQGRFYERQRYPTGHLLSCCRSGNVLITRAVFDSMLEWFDNRFALSGAEDSEFFQRALRAGHQVTWADRAEVYEWVPAERVSPRWLAARAYAGGNNHSRMLIHARCAFPAMLRRVSVSSIRIMQGLLVWACPFFPLHRRIRGRMRIAEGLGALAAFWGSEANPYRNPTVEQGEAFSRSRNQCCHQDGRAQQYPYQNDDSSAHDQQGR